MRAYMADLSDDDDAADLTEQLSLACVWFDLCTLAGELVPADVEAAINAPVGAPASTVSLARPAVDDLMPRLSYLTGLAAQWTGRAKAGDTEAADMLACLNRCLDLPIDCLDGAFVRRIERAGEVQA